MTYLTMNLFFDFDLDGMCGPKKKPYPLVKRNNQPTLVLMLFVEQSLIFDDCRILSVG